jgi:hypothetical protein
MTDDEIRAAAIHDLVARFAELGIEQDQCGEDEIYMEQIVPDDAEPVVRFRRLYREMDAISRELKARGPEARRKLMPLYEHPNLFVRLQAARFSYGAAPEAARKCIQNVADYSMHLYASFNARMCLALLDDGTGKLD